MLAVVPILPYLLAPILPVIGGVLAFLLALLGIYGGHRQRMYLKFLWKQRYSLLVLLGISFLGWSVGRAAFRHWTRPVTQLTEFETGQDWPMFRGGPLRTGAVTADALPVLQTLRWSGARNDSFYSSPTVVGNRVYAIGSAGGQARIFCWDKRSGDLQSVSEPDGMRTTFSSPVVAGDLLLCGEGVHSTTDSRVFCLSFHHPERVGALRWSLSTHAHVESTPVIVGDRVYVAAGDDGVYALALHGDKEGYPKVIWHVPSSQLIDVETSLIADSQRVYVGTGEGGHELVCLDSQTGREIYRRRFTAPLYAPPAMQGDRLYVGMGIGNYVESAPDGGGVVSAVEASTGKIVWTLPLPATVLGAIAIQEDELIFGCSDGHVRVVSRDGKVQKSWNAGAAVLASLAVTSRSICGVSATGRLFLLDRRSLALHSEYSIGRDGNFISSPVITDDCVIVGTEKYGLLCIGPGDPP